MKKLMIPVLSILKKFIKEHKILGSTSLTYCNTSLRFDRFYHKDREKNNYLMGYNASAEFCISGYKLVSWEYFKKIRTPLAKFLFVSDHYSNLLTYRRATLRSRNNYVSLHIKRLSYLLWC